MTDGFTQILAFSTWVSRWFVGFAIIFLLATNFFGCQSKEYPKRAPFTAIRWDDRAPLVEIDGAWYTMVSIDGIAVDAIVKHSQNSYGSLWQKRFTEDLVEVLAGMGHKAGDTVKLVVVPDGATDPVTLDSVPMTEANRDAVYGTSSPVPFEMSAAPLAELIPDLRAQHKLVGLAAMVMVDGQIIASAADGERKKGSGVPVTVDDRWHVGSITKSITATTIARLVEAGKMDWDDTVGAYFPDAPVHAGWKPVTIRQLLTHTAGAPPNFSLFVRLKKPAPGPKRVQARLDAVLPIIATKPDSPPGSTHAYSNVGYTIAGAMAEKAAGEPWEDLVTEHVFEPLALEGAGFGPPKSPDATLDQPRGHRPSPFGKIALDDKADNTPIMGPAGTVHMTLAGLCTYATDHLRGENGAGKLLTADTYNYLHTPERDDYACGWVEHKTWPGIPHTVYWHNGSNTMWYAFVAFIPDRNMVVAVTSNDGSIEQAEAAALQIVWNSTQQVPTDAAAFRTPTTGRT